MLVNTDIREIIQCNVINNGEISYSQSKGSNIVYQNVNNKSE